MKEIEITQFPEKLPGSFWGITTFYNPQRYKNKIENYRKFRAAGKPIIFSIFGGAKTEECMLSLRDRGMSVFSDVYEAISCVGVLYAHRKRLLEPQWPPDDAEVDVAKIEGIVGAAIKEGRSSLLLNEAKEVLVAAGIPMPYAGFMMNQLKSSIIQKTIMQASTLASIFSDQRWFRKNGK